MSGVDTERRKPGWLWVLVVTGAVLAVLLVGASVGLLIQLPDRDAAAPGPESVAVGFSQDMSVHHRQGVLMAGIARGSTADPEIATLAYDIETTQLEQLGRMQGWLSLWDAAALPTGKHMQWMTAPGGGGVHAGHGMAGGVEVMPGMATPQELQRLEEASGLAQDILFLQLMIRHHQGGTGMMEQAAEHAQVPQVRNLASQMRTAQTAEVVAMTAMLADRGAAPLPPPT
ncbi:MAG TPA: DUF305 domain-containing protein [Pseudonocardiaceae bacterium]|jgi:uncharacterized protein (DUF305 family)|nr:DUF305 domain-containing protein [Pseudonocardiaceae bacterium]